MLSDNKYKKCPRCDLNYIAQNQELCAVCQKEINGECDDFDDDLIDICPFCEKHALPDGEEMCASCRRRHQKEKTE